MSNKREWLYCNSEWQDVINVVKLEKNHTKRLKEFNFLLNVDGDNLTTNDVVNNWTVLAEDDIKDAADEWFHEDMFNHYETDDIIYWFFNIYTGEARHIKYTIKINCSGIIAD